MKLSTSYLHFIVNMCVSSILYLPFLYIWIYLFICFYFWLHWVFVAARGLSLVAASRGYSSLRCAGFSLWWLLLLQSTGSRRTGFSSCGSQAQLLRGIWDLPGPGLKPMSPALAGRFLTTVPTGKPSKYIFHDFSMFNVILMVTTKKISKEYTQKKIIRE